MKRLLVTLSALAFLATPVAAQEVKSWTGIYVGVHGGLDASSLEAGAGGAGIDGLAANGAAFGVHGGYDWQLPGSPLVIGIGADYTWSNSEFSAGIGGGPSIKAGIEDSATLYGKLGISLGDVLPYLLAGYSWADGKASWDLGGMGKGSGSESLEGYMLGGGVEFRLADNVTLAGEYRYTSFDSVKAGGVSLDVDRHEVRAALKYRFNPL